MIIVLPGSLNQGGVRTGSGGASSLTPATAWHREAPHVSPFTDVTAHAIVSNVTMAAT